jgi:hypothetical protein
MIPFKRNTKMTRLIVIEIEQFVKAMEEIGIDVIIEPPKNKGDLFKHLIFSSRGKLIYEAIPPRSSETPFTYLSELK